MARESSPELDCASDGSFEALQCREEGGMSEEGGVSMCSCVRPNTGEVIQGTQVTVADIADAPDCNRIGEKWTSLFQLLNIVKCCVAIYLHYLCMNFFLNSYSLHSI